MQSQVKGIEDEYNHFCRLQYLFRMKLDREQRVQVLVELRILLNINFSSSCNWIRRGLDTVRSQRRLYELWNSMMRRLSTDQQEPNPFSFQGEDIN